MNWNSPWPAPPAWWLHRASSRSPVIFIPACHSTRHTTSMYLLTAGIHFPCGIRFPTAAVPPSPYITLIITSLIAPTPAIVPVHHQPHTLGGTLAKPQQNRLPLHCRTTVPPGFPGNHVQPRSPPWSHRLRHIVLSRN